LGFGVMGGQRERKRQRKRQRGDGDGDAKSALSRVVVW